MSRQLQTLVTDDLDGSDAAGTVRFAFQGVEYEIDLNEQHLREFAEFLAPYIEYGRRLRVDRRGPRQRPGPGRQRAPQDLSAVRRWAREQGYEVGDRGRISAEILAKYAAAVPAPRTPTHAA